MSELGLGQPKFANVLRLRCLYCGQEPLRAARRWLDFRDGCPRCRYPYEREVGYFTGASWMINFSAAALLGIALGMFLLTRDEPLGALTIAALINVAVILGGFAVFPYGKALWMWLDHKIHPLNEQDRARYEAERHAAAPGASPLAPRA